ncbi:MAG: tRNA (cytidine(34)-2'-O)-methyltransferase [Verrucomicrobiales bacterium]
MLNVVLNRPEIPPNTGNIGRLCHATGAKLHLIEPLGFSLDERSLKRAGLDYWKEIAPTLWPSYEDFRASVPAEARVYLLTTKTERPYWDAAFQPGDYIVFGSETRGLPESLLESNVRDCLTIPQVAGRSLNLATAAGIVLYEGIRQLTK